jgi:hypothetical protein
MYKAFVGPIKIHFKLHGCITLFKIILHYIMFYWCIISSNLNVNLLCVQNQSNVMYVCQFCKYKSCFHVT